MKISDKHSFYVGEKYQERIQEQAQKHETAGSNIFAGDMDIFQRRKQAQEKAMKVIGDAFAQERAIDEDLQERRKLIQELEAENLELQKQIDGVNEEQSRLMEQYGITEDSTEQQELELLRRCSKNKQTAGAVTKEEREQAAQIRARGLTEYQQRQLEYDAVKESYYDKQTENMRTLKTENAVIRGIRQERLKYNPMAAAKEEAQQIKEAASEEILSMAADKMLEKLDEEQEERQEQAQKLEEQQKEQEALIEKRQEAKDKQEQALEDMPVEELVQLDSISAQVQEEVKSIVNKLKLVAEDIKGAAVDKAL